MDSKWISYKVYFLGGREVLFERVIIEVGSKGWSRGLYAAYFHIISIRVFFFGGGGGDGVVARLHVITYWVIRKVLVFRIDLKNVQSNDIQS